MSNQINRTTFKKRLETHPVSNGVNVLMLSTDRTMLKDGSQVQKRTAAYAECLGHLDVIVLSVRDHRYAPIQIGEHVRVYPTNSRSRWFYGLDAWRLARTLSRVDIVTTQDPFESGLVGYFIARKRGIPLHVQVHTDFLSPEFTRHSLLNRIRAYIARLVLPRAARVRAVSERIRNSLKTGNWELKAEVTVLPIFVDIEKFRTVRADEGLASKLSRFSKRVLVVSRLESEKNIQLAIHSFAKAAPEDACLIIAGEGRERQKLEQLAARLGMSNRTFFLGRHDAASLYPLSDLVLIPSKYEGYGLVIIEALAAGKPVIATDVGIAREAGAIVAAEKDFANALAKWFKNGLREGVLRNYPYRDLGEYVRAYCESIRAAVK